MYYRGYQKVNHILLCDDDKGENEGKGHPVKRAEYDECTLLECSDVCDIHGNEIYEGDIVRVRCRGKEFQGILNEIPDMFKSRGLHPLHHLLAEFGLTGSESGIEFEIAGNEYEYPSGK